MSGSAHLLMLSYWINDNDDEWTRLVCGRWYECEHQVGCKWVTKLQVLDFLKGVFVGWCNRSVLNYGLVKLGCWLGWDASRLRWSGLDVWIMVGPGWWVGVALRWVLVWVFYLPNRFCRWLGGWAVQWAVKMGEYDEDGDGFSGRRERFKKGTGMH